MSADAVCLIYDLDPADAFLIRAFRNWAVGRRDGRIAAWAEVWETFHVALGDDRAPEGVDCFERVLAALCTHARRTIFHHAPNCPCVGADETDLVRLIAALAHGESVEACRVAMDVAVDVVHPDGVGPLLKAAADFARALRQCDQVPTLRAVLRPAGVGGPFMAKRPHNRHLH